MTQHNGRRADAFTTHLKPILSRPNLTVVTGCHATKIGLEQGAGKPRAVGVEFSTGHVPGSERFTGARGGRERLSCGETLLPLCCPCCFAAERSQLAQRSLQRPPSPPSSAQQTHTNTPPPTAELAPSGEVLLCSGTVANPQLLMLSGIGPEAQLRDLGLPVVAASEGVGANLQDHPATLYAAL